jgi:hypothetical protein
MKAKFDCLVCGKPTDGTSLVLPLHGDYRVPGSCAAVWHARRTLRVIR